MKTISTEKISTLALVLLITGAIDSIRNLPATALFGPSLIFFFLLSAIIFLIPVALVSAELSSTFAKEEGGIYSWVKNAFGPTPAFFTIWLQWINTMVWYPTILSFIAGILAYLIEPSLAQNKFYLIAVILTVFWTLTFIGMSGLQASAKVASVCAIFGMLIPMGLIILLAIIWLVMGKPLQINLSMANLLPDLHHSQSWVSLTAIMTSFLGMELACVHVKQVKNPQQNFPRAMLVSVLLILTTMILGSLAIAFVLPQQDINLVAGVMQAFTNFFDNYHMSWLLPLLTVMLLVGSLGSMINWVISPAKGLLMAAESGFLPKKLRLRNKHGVASNILLLQAILVTLLCSGFLLVPSVNGIYWFFTDLSTELYMLMYVMMFIAAIRLKKRYCHLERPFAIPGGQVGYYAVCAVGLIGCALTLFIGFIPPSDSMDMGSTTHYRLLFGGGILAMIFPALCILVYKNYRKVSHV